MRARQAQAWSKRRHLAVAAIGRRYAGDCEMPLQNDDAMTVFLFGGDAILGQMRRRDASFLSPATWPACGLLVWFGYVKE